MNTYADGRLTSAEAASLASEIIRGKWNQFSSLQRPARSQTFASHLHRLSLSFRNTKGESDYCLAAESLFRAVITHTDILERIEYRKWKKPIVIVAGINRLQVVLEPQYVHAGEPINRTTRIR